MNMRHGKLPKNPTHFHAPVPYQGFVRRRKTTGGYGLKFNYMVVGRWLSVMQFLRRN